MGDPEEWQTIESVLHVPRTCEARIVLAKRLVNGIEIRPAGLSGVNDRRSGEEGMRNKA